MMQNAVEIYWHEVFARKRRRKEEESTFSLDSLMVSAPPRCTVSHASTSVITLKTTSTRSHSALFGQPSKTECGCPKKRVKYAVHLQKNGCTISVKSGPTTTTAKKKKEKKNHSGVFDLSLFIETIIPHVENRHTRKEMLPFSLSSHSKKRFYSLCNSLSISLLWVRF